MPTSTPNLLGARRGLERSHYYALLGGLVAATLLLWVPFYSKYLALAAGMGTLSFAIRLLEIRRRAFRVGFHFVSFFGTIIAQQLGSDLWLPHERGLANSLICVIQFMAIWMMFFAGLHFIFRSRLKRDLESYAS